MLPARAGPPRRSPPADVARQGAEARRHARAPPAGRIGGRRLKLAFLGSPEAAAISLRALLDAGHEVKVVVTRPDKRRGRGGELIPTPVKAVAVEHGLPVTSDPAEAPASGAELGVVVAYGRIIKPDVLAALPMVNVHFSLLPRWRGAAPVERSILAGDERTGVCLMEVEEGLDTGGVYRRAEVSIGEAETADELTARLAAIGAELLVTALDQGLGEPVPQEGEATYAAKIEPPELRLDWSRPAAELHRIVRLGRAWTTFRGRRLLVLRAHPIEGGGAGAVGSLDGPAVTTGDGVLVLDEVQPEGRRPGAAAEWLRGARPAPGEALG